MLTGKMENYGRNITANIRSLRCFITALTLLIPIVSSGLVAGALRNVNLIIEPPAVRRGQHATLRCSYDLEGAPLYSAKFYRGQLEFYRYTPGESPSTKVFPFPGIYVDVSMSNASQVVIRNVGFGLSGNFSCEVTADAPLFSTATALGTMQVVELPEKRPLLFAEHNRYVPGDILRANCSTPPSRPRAELKFTINNMMINAGETQFIRTVDNLIASRISLKLQLQGIHFTGSSVAMSSMHGGGSGGGQPASVGGGVSGVSGGGNLVLRCTAQIDDLYQEYKELELGTPQRDPVPARVTLPSGSSVKSFFSSYFSSAAASVTAPHFSLSQLLISGTSAALLLAGNARHLLTLLHELTFGVVASINRTNNNNETNEDSKSNDSNNSSDISSDSNSNDGSNWNQFENGGNNNHKMQALIALPTHLPPSQR